MSETYRPWLKTTSRIGKNIAKIVAIATGLSAIAGVLYNLYEFANSYQKTVKAAQISQLTSYSSFGKLLEHYRKIEQKTDDFIRAHRNGHWDYEALLKQYKTGASLYYSPKFRDFREIREFYEELGTLVRYKALDGELVFQLITFPSDFQETTKPLQNFISDHWFELRPDPNQRKLKGFGSNMVQLEKNYEKRRNHLPVKWDEPFGGEQ
jgi:hypothetical protein